MKKNYVAPKSVNVQLDPLMVAFGIASASPKEMTTPIQGTQEGGTTPGGAIIIG